MPRPRLCRWVRFEPNITYFKPVGVRMVDLDEVILTVDEIEAVRLKDLEEMDQEKAAKKMNISQPTFHRLILSARKKIADAIVNGKAIKIEGGNFKMIQTRVRGAVMGRGFGRMGNPPTKCVCPSCGYEEVKVRGVQCRARKCPKCNTIMIGGN